MCPTKIQLLIAAIYQKYIRIEIEKTQVKPKKEHKIEKNSLSTCKNIECSIQQSK